VAAWQAGAISQATMFDLFRRGEVLPPGRTDAEESRLTAAMQNSKLEMQNGNTSPQPSPLSGEGVKAGTANTQ